MKLAIMQPYVLPYIGYFQMLNAVDRFIYLDDVNYIKKGWINRNKIIVNKKEHLFTIPLEKPSQNKLICDTRLHNSFIKWCDKFEKTLLYAYKNSINFDYYYPAICATLNSYGPYFSIAKLCVGLNNVILKRLNIKTEVACSSDYKIPKDFKGEDRILRLCLLNKADHYINAIGGKDLYTKSRFEEKGINISFIKCEIEKERSFNPHISILDLVFNYSTCDIQEMLYNYSLVQNG